MFSMVLVGSGSSHEMIRIPRIRIRHTAGAAPPPPIRDRTIVGAHPPTQGRSASSWAEPPPPNQQHKFLDSEVLWIQIH